MKFLFLSDNSGAPFYQRVGLAKALVRAGHDAMFWQPERKPAFDAFGEYEPDVFIGQTYNTSRAVAKCIKARPHMKVALFASALGEVLKDVDVKRFPIVVASDDEKRVIETLKKETGKPDFVWIHHHRNQAAYSIGGWLDQFGIPVLGSGKAADLLTYWGGKHDPLLDCDVGYIGGYWPYKAQNLNKYLLPLCGKHDVKIFGNTPWPVPQHLGFIDEGDAKNLFASAKICPNVYEPHSVQYGRDPIERPFKVLAAGGFVLDAGYVRTIHEDFFPSKEIPYAQTPKEFFELVHFFLSKPLDREIIAKNGQLRVLYEHTYFHRVSEFLHLLGFPTEAEGVMGAYRQWTLQNCPPDVSSWISGTGKYLASAMNLPA